MRKANSLIRRVVILIMLILSFYDAAIAGDNGAIGVSCSIPVVPGLNAPLDAKQEVIQENSYPQTMLTEAKDSSLTTIYYR
jgi:hypothetical protein